jgi:hypothetical protein
MKSALLSLTIGSLLLSGCWLFRPNNPPTPCAELDPDFLSYFAFPEGSWWVYREVNSGRKDSLWMSQFAILEDVPIEGSWDCYDEVGFQLTNGDSTRFFIGVLDSSYAHSLEGHSLLFSLREFFYLPGGTRGLFQIFYPPSKDSSIFLSSGFELLPLQDSYSSNGQTFGPVIWSRQHPPFRYYTPVVETIFAQGVGMISWTTISGELWELEKYHLE